MSAFLKLLEIYKNQGLDIRTGLNPYHFNNYRDAPFTALHKQGKIISTGGGLSLQEVYFFECLFENYTPKNIFIIGNAFGWSTVLLSLLNSKSKVIALDAGIEGEDNDLGINLTNEIAKEENLNLKVVKGFSPNDVSAVVKDNFNNKINFVFIDGLHTNKQQELDFDAVFNHCHENCVYVFHDVINWKMTESFLKITSSSGLNSSILYRTPSGMGALYPDHVSVHVKECIQAFSEKEEIIESLLKSQSISNKYNIKIINLLPKAAIIFLMRMKRSILQNVRKIS